MRTRIKYVNLLCANGGKGQTKISVCLFFFFFLFFYLCLYSQPNSPYSIRSWWQCISVRKYFIENFEVCTEFPPFHKIGLTHFVSPHNINLCVRCDLNRSKTLKYFILMWINRISFSLMYFPCKEKPWIGSWIKFYVHDIFVFPSVGGMYIN